MYTLYLCVVCVCVSVSNTKITKCVLTALNVTNNSFKWYL